LTITPNVKDLDANALASNYSWNYNIVNTQGYFAAGPDPFYSKDGSTWVEVESTSSPNSGWHNYVGYGNKMFVMVGGASPYIYYSTDARTWTAATLTVQGGAACNNLNSVVYANSIWVAVGEDEHAWSSDGINWTCIDVGDGNNQMAVAYGNGKFISVPSSGGNTGETGKYSTDGENWTTFSQDNISRSSNPMGRLIYANNIFVSVGSNSISYSTDGTTWSSTGHSVSDNSARFMGVAYGNGKFVAMTGHGYSSTSTDGQNWTQSSSTKLVSSSGGGGDHNAGRGELTFGNNLFVFVGYYRHSPSTYYIWTSTDGASWTSVSTNFGTSCIGDSSCNRGGWGIAYGTVNISEYPAP
jgi:hypothetical protein